MLEKITYKELLSHAFDIPVSVTYWDGKTETYGEGEPKAKIEIKKQIPLKEMTAKPTLVLAEAYMNGDIEIDGSIQELVASAFRADHSFLTNNPFLKHLPRISHSEKASESDIQKHYDIGNDFYRLWLDKSMTYSCAYFEHDDDTLEQAQLNKDRHILHKLDPQPGNTLLDIGSGWGTLLFMAAEDFGLNATGITLSQEQYDYTKQQIKERHLEGKVDVLLEDYREVKGQFNYVTSVGMFEHVGKENLGLYFKKVHDFLKPEGRALIHGITGQHEGAGVDPFLNEYIFHGGYIPNVAENMKHIMDAGMQMSDLEPLRRHYQKTLEIWYANYMKVIDHVKEKYGVPFARMWGMYLQASAASFEAGNIDVMQYLLTNSPSGTGLPMTRQYVYQADGE
ncbi:Cyclopropane-fatty-acyl-phospholipid synthase [Lentilactobacillus parabuchneri]|jgi:cyclopropane-fatty-acyl-phospholipid synthase|uniref:Cyclopropane-fatty-acyl-phospholipid synthase n=3 Tax=Lentilactobacillus parabuchneri TaxID=152331 RepID=A0A1X1FDV2_9LACO|nr:cyclopropane-fatty-acyl-phospholipid synthase family protein [Lentilactobacillus parabuchneri]APR07813.1 Cyclopropane-fatty-acyl-phospholipid synthase [Lentilactobacillus parabuchneri]KRM47055.1 cyclopropane-fatty-acyl-phospholipid synthase [Lentilactobacillus parabuchneri DSM 5707 = NBRC 107865]KRN70816.1 cyclopropane-fatty-acyl-phospholipid synthase [Lentilactobacillus parabuchneri]MBW0222217.1 cyclopropane-fatty-acyl-phospholipid synthase family protein [Lentilactobacillus parabuchneri]M